MPTGETWTFSSTNAGFGDYSRFVDTSWERNEEMIRVNIVSCAELCHRFLANMRRREKPSYIVNVSSVVSFWCLPFFANYAATKTYLRIFSESLAAELSDTKISVTCVCPGSTTTGFAAIAGQRQPEAMSPEQVAAISLRAMLRRRRLVITGTKNRFACLLSRFMPRSLIARVSPSLLGPPKNNAGGPIDQNT